VAKSIEDIARARGVSEIAIQAWKETTRQCVHDFLPWEFDNETGAITRGQGISGFSGQQRGMQTKRRKRLAKNEGV
jgi:hypothetical protein